MEISEEERARIQEKVDKLKDSRFKQQTLPAWRPIPSFASTMITFGVFGLIFLCLGIVLYIMSDQIQEVLVDYTDCTTAQCTLEVEIAEDIEAPVYVYYQLENFYQNHRRYVKSRDYQQLMGEVRTEDEIKSSCNPIVLNSDLGLEYAADGTTLLNQTAPANPCGLVAKSLFNDTYQFFNVDPSTASAQALADGNITINDSNIAWKSDTENKFANCEGDCGVPGAANWTQVQWTDVTNPHFIVWMRTAGLPNFRKLWGQIDEKLNAGKYYVVIQNSYPVSSFNGKKSFVLSTTNMLGGKNYFLAVCYIVVGSLCLVFAIIFLIAYMTKRPANPN